MLHLVQERFPISQRHLRPNSTYCITTQHAI